MSHGCCKLPSNSDLSTTKNQISIVTSKPCESKPHMLAWKLDNVTFVVNNCSFSECSVTLSGKATNGSTQESIFIEVKQICTEMLKGINVDDIFGD